MIKVSMILDPELDPSGNIQETKMYFDNILFLDNHDTGLKKCIFLEKVFENEDDLILFFSKIEKNSHSFSKEDIKDRNNLQVSFIFPYILSEKKVSCDDYLVHIYNKNRAAKNFLKNFFIKLIIGIK